MKWRRRRRRGRRRGDEGEDDGGVGGASGNLGEVQSGWISDLGVEGRGGVCGEGGGERVDATAVVEMKAEEGTVCAG